jgi:hypothetical protein
MRLAMTVKELAIKFTEATKEQEENERLDDLMYQRVLQLETGRWGQADLRHVPYQPGQPQQPQQPQQPTTSSSSTSSGTSRSTSSKASYSRTSPSSSRSCPISTC